jgi:CHASE2 domain-containing sensor protein
MNAWPDGHPWLWTFTCGMAIALGWFVSGSIFHMEHSQESSLLLASAIAVIAGAAAVGLIGLFERRYRDESPRRVRLR